MKKIFKMITVAAISSGLFLAASVYGHHSFNMFDRTYLQLIEGKVTDWNFNNPHSWLFVEAPDENGEMKIWSFEGASPVHAVRSGVIGNTFTKGEIVKIVMSPMKDGREGGAMCFVVKENMELTFPGDASCNKNLASTTWMSNGWVENGEHLDTHPN